MAKPLTQLIKTLTDSTDEATKAGQATADGFTDDALAEISNQVDEFDFSGAKERAINSETMKPKYSEFTGRQDEALYKQSDVYFEDVKNEFLDNFEPDVDADEIMFSLDSFSPKMQGFLKQMNNADWLGFDYPSQAINQVLKGDLEGFDIPNSLKQSLGRLTGGLLDGESMKNTASPKSQSLPMD
ncbi:MAG: hypothetical protein GY829_14835, partial [Gammaproteobacteria bacterium]|nr:hypothetical protein [Gammaproteobacteria bacterium]